MRYPAQVEHHEDDLPLGQDQDQQADRRGGEGHAGRHQSRIFRCGIICPYHVVFADYCFQYKQNVKYKSFCAKLPLLSLGGRKTIEVWGSGQGGDPPPFIQGVSK